MGNIRDNICQHIELRNPIFQEVLARLIDLQSDHFDYHSRYRAPGTFRPSGKLDPTPPARGVTDWLICILSSVFDHYTNRYWGWLPNLLRDWVLGEQVPPLRYKGDTSEGPRLPALGMPMERAFAAHVAVTRRELRRNAELSDEVETLRLQVSQLMTQHGQMVNIMQEHDGRITENRTNIAETQAMVQASDAMLNAWAAQFIEDPPAEDDGPQFEAKDLEEGDFDEDPNEDPEEDDDNGDAASDISHVSMDSD
ncbi:hypothetical protein E3N88_29251 [Mikania micrantha]|uniref:Uncharacterized protein n=1 Tax=Mikania micrantha TaxID=192012 RepID=A0A5N6MIX0_9ASTR|nr:hypothetical protein E3N88_29251 [Mikania micrantha]